MSREARSLGGTMARNSLLNLAGLGLPLVLAVFAVPPIMRGLGTERFGVLGLVWVGFAYMAMLDLGLGRATTRFAATAIAEGRESRLRSIVGSAAAAQLVIGFLSALALVVCAGFLVDRLELSAAGRAEAWWSFALLALAAPLATTTNSFRGALEAGQRFGWVNSIRVPVSTANFLVPWIGVYAGWSIPMMVVGMIAMRAVALVAFAAACAGAWPGLLRGLRVERATLRELAGFGGWVTVSTVVSSLYMYVDRIVLAAFVTMEAVGYYTVPHEMVTRLTVLPSAFVLTLFPALSALSAAGAPEDRRAGLIARSVALLLPTITASFIALAVVGGDLLALWLGDAVRDQSAVALTILALGMAAMSISYIGNAALQAAGRPSVTARIHLAELPVYIVLIAWLIPAAGVTGAALAWASRALLDAGLLMIAVVRLRLVERRHWHDAHLGRGVLLLAGFALAASVARSVVTGEAGAIVSVAAILGACFAAAWLWLLDKAQRRRIVAGLAARRAQPNLVDAR